jgi:TonB family protein
MLNQNLARFRFKHNLLILAVGLAFAGVQGLAQAKNDPPKQGTAKSTQLDSRCQAKPTSTTLAKPPDHWSVGKGERYLRSPRVSLSVDENGTVTEAKITRTSGIKEIDDWVLSSVKAWKYNAAPGCGIRDVDASVSINFSAADANAAQ